ncbi:hypothetical protein [Jiella pacifica]|uniref:Cysteine rich repeat-containing protein n=1 Tax=Jiella pacifica TaxID=2696469 RepID=A0A6N9T9D2_9HYPH|nr:hypothetical protein [Jiella pacifica]NDW06835.1 hypothetical protein [Jiella pacifica]
MMQIDKHRGERPRPGDACSSSFGARRQRNLRPGALRSTGRTIALTVGLLSVGNAGFAAAPTPAVKEECGTEIRSMCLRPWRLTPSAISACVADHQSELSPTCQDFWETAQICQHEMVEVCGGLNPFTIKSCLRNSKAKFSPLCQETLDIDE